MNGAVLFVWLYSTLCGGSCAPFDEAFVLRNQVVTRALSFVGSPYRWGATGERGFDCAGLVQRVYSEEGIPLPRTSGEQYYSGEEVPLDQLEPGDLVFFRNTYKRGISHVGIYAGNHVFIHASSSRRQVIAESIRRAYYTSRLAGARRLIRSLRQKSTPTPPDAVVLAADESIDASGSAAGIAE